jgi:predicted metalloprotease
MTRFSPRSALLFAAVLTVLLAGPARAGAKGETYAEIARSEDMADYLEVVADDVDDLWDDSFARGDYHSPTRFVVVAEEMETGCGPAEPGFYNAYYCPLDGAIYVDPVLMEEIGEMFGPFAAAVVIAHEWGHHLQDQRGLLGESITVSLTDLTSLQTELQADCLAGTWAAGAADDGRLEPGDLDRAVLMMASFMGDSDHRPNGTHDDPSYLDHQHGDGALRAWWFLQGFNDGVEACGL